MDTSDPSISFDSNGISNHYYDFQENVLPNWKNNAQGEAEISKLFDHIRSNGKGKDFDCILGLSGGLDSSYMLHKAITQYGLRPLVFHVDGGWNSDVAVSNIYKLVNTLNLDLFTEVIDWHEMQRFQLAMFKAGVPHLDTPQDMAFIAVLYKFAAKHGIKYILNGGNISTECVLMPLQFIYWATDTLQIADIFKKTKTPSLRNFPFSSILYHKFYLRYMKKVKVIKPLNFMHFDKKSAESELSRLYNWTPYPQKHFESRFTRFFEGYWLPNRFGYDMRRNQLSSLILTGQMSRDNALKILESPPLDPLESRREFKYISDKLCIAESELQQLFEMPLKYFYDYKNLNWLFDIGSNILSRFSNSRRFGAF